MALLVRKSNELNEYFGIFATPYHKEGRDIDDYSVYFLNGTYYMIPNSAVFRKSEFTEENYIELLNKNSPKDMIREILDKFYEELVKYSKNVFSLDLKIKHRIISRLGLGR